MDASERRLRREERAGAREMMALLASARAEVRRALRSLPADSAAAEVIARMLPALDNAMRRVREEGGRRMGRRIGRSLRLGIATAEAQIPQVAGTPILFNFNGALLQSVLNTDAWLVRVTRALREKVANRLQIALLAGTSIRDVARGIEEDGINPLGPFKTAASRAEAIAVTEINRAYNVGTWNRYQDAGLRVPGLLKEWVTAEDGRVRESHAALNGVRVPVGEAFSVGGHPAMHPQDDSLPAGESVRCRCRLVPVVPDDTE